MPWPMSRPPPAAPPHPDREAEVDELVSTVELQLGQLQATVAEMARRLRAGPGNGDAHA
jgi:hypothetical protein